MTPTEEPFFGSKTMVLLALCIAAILLLVLVGVVVLVVWHVNAFEMVAAGIAGVTGQSAQGTYRNVRTDTPMRISQSNDRPEGPI